jgi:signal-transduction protein with cAMP-binding, CBS, and nucleotidyltransferase domain
MHDTYHERVQEVERLACELNTLLLCDASFLRQRHMHRKARRLVHWVDSYREGLRYGALGGDKPAAQGNAWMTGVSDRFKLETEMKVNSESLIVEESDSGEAETEDFIRSARHIIHTAHMARKISAPLQDKLSSTKKENAMLQTRVKDLMQINPVIISPDFSLRQAAQEMEVVNCGMLPVGTADKIEGIITDRDIVLRAVAKGKDTNTEKVRDYMTPDVCSVCEDDATYRAADMMREKNVNRLMVSDEKGRPRGVLTFGRILRQDESMQEIAIVIECAVGQKDA